MKVGITYHEKFCQYDLGLSHPFRGDRFRNAMSLFEDQGLFCRPYVILLKPRAIARQDLLRVHDKDYVDLIFRLGETNKRYDVETPVSPEILEAAQLIIGGGVEVGKAVYTGKIDRGVALGCGFHHSGRNYGGGFCLFNDIAVLVEHLREKYGLKRVLVLDYDVHFGNGTSEIYYSDPDVLFISIHQDPRTLYPGTGFIEQIGKGAGEGYNVNVPLPPGTGDQTYLYALREIFIPLAEEFKPGLIIANGGSDSHFADRLGNLALTLGGFFTLSQMIVEVAKQISQGKLILMLGSGYNPLVLPSCWFALTAGVAGLATISLDDPYNPPGEPLRNRRMVEKTLMNLKKTPSKYWGCFQ